MQSIKYGKESDKVSFHPQSPEEEVDELQTFSLKPLQPMSSCWLSVTMCFHSSENQEKNGSGGIPRFNRDGLYNTPSFVTQQEKERTNSSFNLNRQRIGETPNDSLLEENQMFIPKPTSNFCQVCKVGYPDYLKHVQGIFHQRQLNKTPYHKEIRKLSQHFSMRRETRSQEPEFKFEYGVKKVKKSFDAHSKKLSTSNSSKVQPSNAKSTRKNH